MVLVFGMWLHLDTPYLDIEKGLARQPTVLVVALFAWTSFSNADDPMSFSSLFYYPFALPCSLIHGGSACSWS